MQSQTSSGMLSAMQEIYYTLKVKWINLRNSWLLYYNTNLSRPLSMNISSTRTGPSFTLTHPISLIPTSKDSPALVWSGNIHLRNPLKTFQPMGPYTTQLSGQKKTPFTHGRQLTKPYRRESASVHIVTSDYFVLLPGGRQKKASKVSKLYQKQWVQPWRHAASSIHRSPSLWQHHIFNR